MAKRFRQEKRTEERVNNRALKELRVPNIPLKLHLGTQNGWPDRLYLLGHGAVLFIEYKDEQGELEPLQIRNHEMLRSLGYNVQVHTNEGEAFEEIARAKLDAARLSEEGS
jgi:hypothetical protein